jgi:mono/diheme cytochrome c family protein
MKRVLKSIGSILAGLLGIVVLLVIGLSAISASRLNRTYEVTADFTLDAVNDPESIAAGERTYAIMCASCHGDDLAGTAVGDDALSGRIYSANLTAGAGGIGAVRSDEELARAIWYGVKPDGSPTVVMPFEFHRGIHVEDMARLIAYIRSAPPVDTAHPEIRPGVMLRVMHAAGLFPVVTAEHVDRDEAPPAAVNPEDTLAHGAYLAVFCTACHGADLAGIEMAGSPSLWPAIGSWTEAEFTRAVREGVRPGGTNLSTEMPWEAFSRYTDEEVRAIWTYLQSLEPVTIR